MTKPTPLRPGTYYHLYGRGNNRQTIFREGRNYGRSGSLFRRPFGRREVTSEQHLIHLVRYIHRNPQTHGLVDDFRTWRYSSYRAILAADATQVRRDEVLAWFSGREAFADAHYIADVGPIGYLVNVRP